MLSLLLVAADLAGTLAVSDRTEVRVRAPGTTPAPASLDVETAPDVRVTLAWTRWRSVLAYTPLLTLWDASTPARRPTWLNAGEARLEWHGARAQIALSEA